jgi:hypothetical protein
MDLDMSSRDLTGPSLHLAVYDGAIFAGALEQCRDGKFRAYDATGALVGIYKSQHEALHAIPVVDHG